MTALGEVDYSSEMREYWVTKDVLRSYSIAFSSREGDHVYVNAVLRTKGFMLKAPKIRVKEGPSRVKIQVLEKVKNSGRSHAAKAEGN